MLFAKTIVALCTVAATVMALDGLRCECDGFVSPANDALTEYDCGNIQGELMFCGISYEIGCITNGRDSDFIKGCIFGSTPCMAVNLFFCIS
ncbi:hypothetical protein EDD21DRAFT_365716 [Dissophora ornata]|nr:hypothetical protein EDD21DRAFT_365716 [Dissophora ornata]